MFRFGRSLDVITLFHKPAQASSVRVNNLLKQLSAQAAATATEDQAADHSHQSKLQRAEFDLNVTEDAPTADQLRSILEYIGVDKAGQLIDGAKDQSDALTKLKQDPHKFKRPVTVDWNNARAVVGDNESQILKMVQQLSKPAA